MALSLEQYRDMHYEDPTIKNILTERIELQRKKALGFSIKNGHQIPEHLIIEILSRLPVKTLLQFKKVCKLWYDIIKSSYFISKHLRNYYDNNNNWRDCLIIQYSITEAKELIVYELLIDDTKNRALSYQCIESPVHNRNLCGPCDGIYYISRADVYIAPKHSLWNPALNEFKILPNITCWKNPPDATYIDEVCGLGYDSKTDDYKVILIEGYSNTGRDYTGITDNPRSILIYSLRTNSWRYWGDIDVSNYLKPNESYVFVNGCCYWYASASRLLTYGLDDFIFSFDVSAETCQEIPLPKLESEPQYSKLIVYQDSIGFVSLPDDNTRFNVYTCNNGVWTQKLSMKLDFGVWGPFSQWTDNMLIFTQSYGKLVLLDTDTKEIFVLDDPQAGDCENICAYKESLVSINDFGRTLSRRQICEIVRYLNSSKLPSTCTRLRLTVSSMIQLISNVIIFDYRYCRRLIIHVSGSEGPMDRTPGVL